MKGKVRVKKDDYKLIFTLMICQIAVLAIGWVVMSSHVGAETDFNITEPALKEPYFSWMNTFITIYWGVGILVTLFSTIALLISKKDNKIQYLLFLIPTLLLSMGFIVDYLIALIKLNGEHYVLWYIGAFTLFVMINPIIVYVKKGKGILIMSWLTLMLTVFSIVLLLLVDSTDKNYIVDFKGSLVGNTWAKITIGAFISVAQAIFFLAYGYLLKVFLLHEN